VSVFSLANNHAFDQGEEGIFQTLRSASELRTPSGGPISVSGIRGSLARPFQPEAISIRGVRIGFLAVTQFINQAGPCPWVNIVDYNDREAADALVLFLRRVTPAYDLFVVSYHGGTEYSGRASAEKAAFFRRLLENGAHVVFSHHPHVFQGFELVGVRGETRLSLLSMGNFISGMTWGTDPARPEAPYAATGDSALLLVDMLVTGAGSYLTRVQAVPVSNYRNERGEMVVGMLEELAAGRPGLSSPWAAYYRDRLGVMQRLLHPLAGAGVQ
jgi:poly-gamma-glutamate synthesis protein (capsule biosynthesis protein)